jgi:hypothetical protein
MWTCACGQENISIIGRCSSCGLHTLLQPLYPVVATDLPCHDCGNEIQLGQSYVPTRRGPEHVGCGRERRGRA